MMRSTSTTRFTLLLAFLQLLLMNSLPTLAAEPTNPQSAGPAPVASWAFDEGSGDVLRDSSGNNNNGKIHGARWVEIKNGRALRFDGVDDYVDCGTGASLNITGPLTLEAWIRPDAPPTAEPGLIGKFYTSYVMTYYKTGGVYFYISDGGNNAYGGIATGQWSHVVGVFDGKMLRFYVNGREVSAKESAYPRPAPGKNFLMGCKFGDPANRDAAMRDTDFYTGLMSGVRVYAHALSAQEIVRNYNEKAAERDQKPFDLSRLGKLGLQAFLYPERNQAVLDVDYHWVQPLPEGARLRAELLRVGDTTTLQSVELKPEGTRDAIDATLPLTGLANGEYTLRAILSDGAGREQKRAERNFHWPLPAAALPSPSQQTAPKLAPPIVSPTYSIDVSKTGGMAVKIKNRTYKIESSFSYPRGGENQLTTGANSPGGETTWKVTTRKVNAREWQVRAEGSHYLIDRTIKLKPTRIEVSDKVTNKTDEVLGIIFSNHINTLGLDDSKNTLMSNPTVFVAQGDNAAGGNGLGLIALDDIYQLQRKTFSDNGRVSLADEQFGLDKHASYTLQWAAYPTATTDYYDFINQVRKDEGLHGYVNGSFAFFRFWNPPAKDDVKNKGLKYASLGSITNVMDNPRVSVEGWEFMEYPTLCEKLKKTMVESKKLFPDLKVGFHVAHSLFATNKPKEMFPDSLLMDINGNTDCYGGNSTEYYEKYFSKEMVADGWRWWLYYPTMENSFGKYMLKAADYMIDEIGADTLWADGYIGGYAPGGYTYDRWDGHSVTIDPKTKLVTRKKGNVTYLAMPVLKAVVNSYTKKGGKVISNDLAPPRSMWKLPMITSNETGGSDQQPISSLHLSQTVTPLGNQTTIKSERDVYQDILAKLDLGALYFWYGEQDFVKEPSIVSHMYPITFESIHAGTVRGKERIVTKNSGVYGWHTDRALHLVYPYDARGKLIDNRFTTTVDASGVRTAINLQENEAAIVAKVPLQLQSASPINVCLEQYVVDGIKLRLNGKGSASLSISSGDFKIHAGQQYRVEGASKSPIRAGKDGKLTVPLKLDGPTQLIITALAD